MFEEERIEESNPRLDMFSELTAYCRGFLLLKDVSLEKACIFCRGFLLNLYHRYFVVPRKVSEAIENSWNLMYKPPEDDKYFYHSVYMR